MREFGCLNDISLNISQNIIPQCLHDLRYVEKCHIYCMTFQGSHGILYNEWVIAIFGQEVRYGRDWIDSGPIKQILAVSALSGVLGGDDLP